MPLPWIHADARISAGAGGTLDWSGQDLYRNVHAAAAVHARRPHSMRLGLASDNGPEWIAVDLAAHMAGAALTPLPGFFTRAQLEHVVRSASLDALWCSNEAIAASLGFERRVGRFHSLTLYERRSADAASDDYRPARQGKVTFTSGSTGTPKGVCLSDEQQLNPARGLAELAAPLQIERHLSLLPLSVLLENVAGVYVSLMLGATCIAPPLAEVGMSGASRFDADRCLDAIARHAPESMILLPQMLRALLARLGCAAGRDSRIASLKFVAVGGAKTSPDLILQARRLGLPVFEGYGLSECGSVVCVNTPFADRVGSVGRALPGTDVRIAADGEVEVAGRGGVHYLGAANEPDAWIRTGDLGRLDADGYLFVSGRRDNLVITSFGRNVAPEWIESLLLAHPEISDAAVFGEGRPFVAAVMSTTTRAVSDEALKRAVMQVNQQLPDYARIGAWLRAQEPFSAENGMATANGRVRRSAVWSRYKAKLNALFDKESVH